MQFGLWFEPEMVNPDSDLARAHPDWILAAGDRLPRRRRATSRCSTSRIPGAYAHMLTRLDALLDEYDIAYIKWDHNRDLVEAGTSRPGGPACTSRPWPFYRLLDELRAAHPGLEIESCSSGGARVDLGDPRAHRPGLGLATASTRSSASRSSAGPSLLLPPELIGAHVGAGRSPHHRPDARPRLPRRRPRCSATSASSGTSPPVRTRAGER